jgi:hypothetical protein
LFNETQTTLIQYPGGLAGSYTIPNSVTNIGDEAFESCGLTSVTIPNSVTNIGDLAFAYCDHLTSVTIPNSVTSIGNGAFAYCGLTNVTIGNSVTNLGDEAFESCDLTSVTIPNSVTSIGDGAFEHCGLTSVRIGNSVTGIGDSAFAYCYHLTSVTIPNSVTSIGKEAFAYCYDSLTSVTIPNSVTSIGEEAFAYCYSLTNITINNSVIGIEEFNSCGSLTRITIGNSVTNIGDSAFAFCDGLTNITVDPSNPAFSSVAGVLFNETQTTLIQYPGGLAGSYTIPDSVTNIGDSAFAFCSHLTSVTIPTSVTSIGDGAFAPCSITSVYFQGNAPSLGWDVFGGGSTFLPYLDPATIYFLPGTTGWGTNYGGLPTALWLPQMQAGGTSLGIQNHPFGFNINWASGMSVVIEASTSLLNPNWSPVATNILDQFGTTHFSDPAWTNYSGRFYRVRAD